MRAELRRLHSPDVQDLRSISATAGTQALLVQAMIGPKGGAGEEAFDFLVCTESWFVAELHSKGSIWSSEYLVLRVFDYGLLRAAVEHLCAEVSGETWEEVALKLNRYARWEFADYRPRG